MVGVVKDGERANGGGAGNRKNMGWLHTLSKCDMKGEKMSYLRWSELKKKINLSISETLFVLIGKEEVYS